MDPAPTSRRAEVERLLERATAWAAGRPDVVALALVGSYARRDPVPGRHAATDESDVDLVLLTDDPATYLAGDDWAAELGAGRVLGAVVWGAVTERRLIMPSGLAVEVGVARPSWAATAPVDGGTRRVVNDGLRVLHDPQGLLARLQAACPPRPTADDRRPASGSPHPAAHAVT